MRAVLGALAICAAVAFMLYGCVVDATNERLQDCEESFERWVTGPDNLPQPDILTEDWCFDHLTER
jgi:hypothetical protein